MASYTQDMSILSGKSFTTSDINLGKPKVNAVGGKNVPIYNAHVKRNLFISSPLMLTWGVTRWEDEKTGKETYDMSNSKNFDI